MAATGDDADAEGTTGGTAGRTVRAARRPVVVAGLALSAAVLVVVSVQPDLLLRLLG